MTTSVTLTLADPDSIRCLRRALENGALSFTCMAVQATSTAAAQGKRSREATRHERRAAEFTRRADLTQQLLDQLPTDTKALLAPMGE